MLSSGLAILRVWTRIDRDASANMPERHQLKGVEGPAGGGPTAAATPETAPTTKWSAVTTRKFVD